MEENKRDIDALIAAFLTGEIEPAQKAELSAWLNQSEDNRRYFMQRQELWFSAINEDEVHSKYDADRAFVRFQRRVQVAKTATAKRRMLHGWLRYAAVAAVLCIVAYFSYQKGGSDLKNSLAQIEVEAPAGSQTRMRLPDSTFVVLNAGSRMVYAQDFGVENREVMLEGEGYFEVTPDANHPFRVISSSVTLTVLGTKFNFRDYPQENEVVVSLRKGKVKLDNLITDEKSLSLVENERMLMDKREGRMKLERIVNDDYQSWVNGKLRFNDLPIKEVVRILSRSYGVDIYLANESLSDMHFNGNFDRNEQGLKEVLEIMQATGKIKYRMQGKQIELY